MHEPSICDCALSAATMADGKKKKKLTKQAIIDLLDENELDLSMSDLTTATLPVKELVRNQVWVL